VGDRTVGQAKSSDGRFLAVSNDGQGVQSLTLFDTGSRKAVQSLSYAAPESLDMN
jgi:hypothetical protein